MPIAKILLVAGSANFSTRDVWDGYRIALEDIGIEVIPYPTFSFLRVLSPDTVCSDILGTAVDSKHDVDCVVFIDGLYFRGERARIPASIRRAGIPTVLIATDDPYESVPHSPYTYCFTNEIHCAGEGVEYLPTATLPSPVFPSADSPTYDLSFVGTVFADRLPLLTALADHCEANKLRFLIAGKLPEGSEVFANRTFTDVRSRTIDEQEKFQIYSGSRVVLNVCRDSDKAADSPNPRVFEVTALGQPALLTGPARSEVREIFGDSVFHFEDADDAVVQLKIALTRQPPDIAGLVERAREITESAHLYHHRSQQLIKAIRSGEQKCRSDYVAEDCISWLIGCGRSGSTWLAEMLAELPNMRKWHEPYFGRFLRHLQDRPQDRKRVSSFFAHRTQDILFEGLRTMFFRMVRHRYPKLGEHGLVIKEVNTPELYEWLRHLFPGSRMILLIRDPFDILDSYLDLQRPGSWNDQFGENSDEPLAAARIERTATHILSTFELALAAYEAFPSQLRLQVSYEQLLQNAAPHLRACSALTGIETSPEAAEKAVDLQRFDKHKDTGRLKFRRHGKSQVWRESPNFTEETREIAKKILGPMRARLGYLDEEEN